MLILENWKKADNQRISHADHVRREEENNQWCARCKTPGGVERKWAQQAAARDVTEVVECKSEQQAAAREVPGVVESKSAQQAAAREVPGVVERKSAQQAAAREETVVWECKSRQRASARLNKTFKMACKYVNSRHIFHQSCGLWNAPCVHGCGYIHLSS